MEKVFYAVKTNPKAKIFDIKKIPSKSFDLKGMSLSTLVPGAGLEPAQLQ